MKRFLFFMFFSFSLLISKITQAEYCWMIGCEGWEGYVFLTEVQQWKEYKTSVAIDGKKCSFLNPEDQFLFKDIIGLPEIGKEVELQLYTPLYHYDEMQKKTELFKNIKSGIDVPYIGTGNISKTVIKYPSTYDGDFPMAEGTILKILSYDNIKLDGEDYLFAYVKVIKDGRR